MVNDIVLAHFCVDHGHLFECFHRRFDKKRHEAQFHFVFLLERLAMFMAEGDDVAHVNFIEGREQSGIVLRGNETLGHRAPQTAHGDNFFFRRSRWCSRPVGSRLRGRFLRPRRGRGTGFLPGHRRFFWLRD